MDFSKYFIKNTESKKYGLLFEKLKCEYPELEHEDLLIVSSVAGLFARVAFVDFELDPSEVTKIKELLHSWPLMKNLDIDLITQIAVEHIKEMSGLDNHIFAVPLKELMSKEVRYKVLQCLFVIAAADGSIDALETEEIRMISKGLALGQKHFIAAKAEVVEFLAVLK